MNKKLFSLFIWAFFSSCTQSYANPDRTQLAVWANEAIIATYTYNYKTYMQQQKELAKYFTAEGWISYSKALNQAQLSETVKKNNYDVTAVATQPPKLNILDATHWQAFMNILVVYQNPQYEQRQHLKVILTFTQAAPGQGIRGFNIISLNSTVTKPPCECPIIEEDSKQKGEQQ